MAVSCCLFGHDLCTSLATVLFSCLDMPHQVILELLLKLQPLALSKCHFISMNILKNVRISKIKILPPMCSGEDFFFCCVAIRYTELQFFQNQALKILPL